MGKFYISKLSKKIKYDIISYFIQTVDKVYKIFY